VPSSQTSHPAIIRRATSVDIPAPVALSHFAMAEPWDGPNHRPLSSVRSFIVVFRSAKARPFRGAKGDYRTVVPRTILNHVFVIDVTVRVFSPRLSLTFSAPYDV
jgi:hypothetical protein